MAAAESGQPPSKLEYFSLIICTSCPKIHDDGTLGKKIMLKIKLEIFFVKFNTHFKTKSKNRGYQSKI